MDTEGTSRRSTHPQQRREDFGAAPNLDGEAGEAGRCADGACGGLEGGDEEGLTKPADVKEMPYLVHSPRWGLGFLKTAQERGATCYLRFPGHPSEKFTDMWDFMVRELGAGEATK